MFLEQAVEVGFEEADVLVAVFVPGMGNLLCLHSLIS